MLVNRKYFQDPQEKIAHDVLEISLEDQLGDSLNKVDDLISESFLSENSYKNTSVTSDISEVVDSLGTSLCEDESNSCTRNPMSSKEDTSQFKVKCRNAAVEKRISYQKTINIFWFKIIIKNQLTCVHTQSYIRGYFYGTRVYVSFKTVV